LPTPLGLLAKPFNEGGGIVDLALGLVPGLALFGGQYGTQIVAVIAHHLEPAPQDRSALLPGPGDPDRTGAFGRSDGARRFCRAHARNPGDDLARGRVRDRDRRPVIGCNPVSADHAGIAQKVWTV